MQSIDFLRSDTDKGVCVLVGGGGGGWGWGGGRSSRDTKDYVREVKKQNDVIANICGTRVRIAQNSRWASSIAFS